MEYTYSTAHSECQVANIAGEAECYIYLKTLTECRIFHTKEVVVF